MVMILFLLDHFQKTNKYYALVNLTDYANTTFFDDYQS